MERILKRAQAGATLMTLGDIYETISRDQPILVYLTGKTCTGKSTFSARLTSEFGYEVIELDRIVRSSVIEKFHETDEPQVFRHVYKLRENMLWVNSFIEEARQAIRSYLNQDKKLVIEGAIFHPDTIRDLFSGFPEFVFIYIHPDNIENYMRNITSRFMHTEENFKNGLPGSFWALIDRTEYKQFLKTGVVSDSLISSIKAYALESISESEKRLEALKPHFNSLKIVEI